jgi:hypothetical protein
MPPLPDDERVVDELVSESEVDNLMQSRFDPLKDVDLEVSDATMTTMTKTSDDKDNEPRRNRNVFDFRRN